MITERSDTFGNWQVLKNPPALLLSRGSENET